MVSKKIWLVLLILLGSSLLWPASSLAQTPTNVVIIYPAAEPQEDSLALSVFFTITDETGRPIPRPGIESADIELLGGDNAPIPATFEDAKTPFYIALVLDASGSMQQEMPGVREAAQAAVDNPPPGARIAVIKFNQLALDGELSIIEPFTSDMALVKGSINAVESEPNAPTCLYNALYKSIELLDETRQQPQERQAIILFTDGKDELADGSPCSQRKYDDVINRATRALPITPIHTIGLCDDAQCSNVDPTELRSMAKDTSAFSATGNPDNMGDVFRGIMEGLSSQLVARANVFARKGENQAVLSVKLRDSEVPLTATFNFFSDRDYNAPAAPVSAQITSLVYDAEKDVYNVAMSVTSPENIYKVVVEVWDEKSGTQLPPPQEFENPEATLQFERHTNDLSAGREYSFRLKAVDQEGNYIPKPAEPGDTSEEGNIILSQQVFVYEPPQVEAIQFVIKSVQADYENKRLFVDLDIPDAGQVNSYEGFIIDEETGAGIYEFQPTLFPGGRIEEPLPETMQQVKEARGYRVTLFLTTKDGRRLQAEPYPFKAVPPPPPGLLATIFLTLQNPPVLISVFVIILCVIGLVIYWNRPAKKEALLSPLPRPPIDHTMISSPAPSVATPQTRQPVPAPQPKPQPPRLRIEVLETPNSAPEMKKLISRF
ncbi:MAG TPA: VWA domain-containing protein, partial [Anaerolineae bacterium]|nr:VWA domain-containing protein [Anaerolineae bacterium]